MDHLTHLGFPSSSGERFACWRRNKVGAWRITESMQLFSPGQVLPISLAVALLIGCDARRTTNATAEIRDPNGAVVGTARFEPDGDNVKVRVEVKGITPGTHGIHVHEHGRCDPPAYESAGGHFNPSGQQQHGGDGHAGGLPNLVVAADGTGSLEGTLRRVSLASQGQQSLFYEGGTSIIIHRDPDDLKTPPSGNSGPRVACGLIVASNP